jgi:hypothetical protein
VSACSSAVSTPKCGRKQRKFRARCKRLLSKTIMAVVTLMHWTLPNYCTLQGRGLKLNEVFVIKDLSGFQSRLFVHITCVLCVLCWPFCWRHVSCKLFCRAVGTFRTQTAHFHDVFLCRILCQILGKTFSFVHYLSKTSDLRLVQFILQFCMYVCMYVYSVLVLCL